MPLLEQAFQTAEACRLAYPGQDWLHLVRSAPAQNAAGSNEALSLMFLCLYCSVSGQEVPSLVRR